MGAKAVLICATFAAAAGAGLLAEPATAAGDLGNQDFGTIGPGGSSVTTVGSSSAWTAASDWYQFTVVPGGSLTTTLLPSSDTFGGDANMLRVVTDSGDWPPAEQGNGFGQSFVGGELLAHATVSFDIDVLSGQVTGGLTKDIGNGIGVFTADEPTFGATGGWIHVVDHADPGTLSDGVFFETLTLQPYPDTALNADHGATYEIANIQVSAPEPATWAMMLAGFAGLGVVGYRASRKGVALAA